MKRITLLSIVILLFTSVTKAQITKGSVYFGGSIGAATSKQEVSTSSNEGKLKVISVNPTIGLAVKNNLIAGVNLSYSNGSRKKYQNSQDLKTEGYGGGFFIRKYFPIVNRFYFFGETTLDYAYQKQEQVSTPPGTYFSKMKQQDIYASLYPGLAFNVFKSFYIETSFPSLIQLGYTKRTTVENFYGPTTTITEKGFAIQSNLTNSSFLNFGVKFIIPEK